ncbi:MAG: dihydroorotate dehydrogenase B catalytic subunit [Nitrosopumilales archaeon]|nr:dihydroorotate dehydrogenase B catalytic subunit [Nitrosopumilales archaeon]
MKPSLSTSIGTLTLERPTILASGILGISLDIFERLYRSGAGAVVTKSLSKEPWDGYVNPTIFSVKGGGWLNAVGLANPGATEFSNMISKSHDVPIIVSLVGSTEDDFDFMVKQFESCKISAYELNLSCPHVAKVGLEVGDDVELVKKIVKKVKLNTNVPVIAKVGLGTTNYLDTVGAACEAGADGITAINTIRAMAIDVETQKPILSNKIGGLSGTPIKPIAVRCVYEISSKFDVPIIGCGGISTWQDAVEFILAGASAVQFGSVLGEHWTEVFAEINNGIKNYMEKNGYSKMSEMIGNAKKS